MFSSLVELVRPAAAVTAVALVVGALQAAPAAAAPRDPLYPAVSLTARVVYPADGDSPGAPGTDIDHPADAGPAPGSVTVAYEFTNVGTEALQYFYGGYVLPLAVGRLDSQECEPAPVFPPEDWELQPTQTVHCTASVSQIPAGTTLEIGVGVAGFGVSTRLQASDTTRVWAQVDAPAPPPPSTPTSIGHLVYVDTNHDGQRDANEPGIPGARLSLRGPDGTPVKGKGDQVSDAHGSYSFDDVAPGGPYTVVLDLSSVDLTDRTPTSFTNGTWVPGASTWSLSTGGSTSTWDSIDFGFFPKTPVTVDFPGLAPTRVVGATYIAVRVFPSGSPHFGWRGPASVEFRAGGTTTWTKIADFSTGADGRGAASPTLRRSGWVRVRTPGDRFYASGVSREFHVVVTTAPVLLYAQAPPTVPRGTPLTVTGSITRSFYPFTTGGILLERSTDGTTWTTVTKLSSDGTGRLTATVDPAVSGSYRYRYPGDSANSPATSPVRRVAVVDAAKESSPRPRR